MAVDGFIYFLALIGLYALSCYLYDNLKTPVLLIFYSLKELFTRDRRTFIRRRYGDWVAITGATDGIGLGYAKELARRGLNVVLISRTEAKLKAVSEQIEKDFNVHTKIIVADFTQTKEIYEHIENELNQLPVRILINNVGRDTPTQGPMASFSADDLWDVINVNIGAATQLSRYFIRRLREAGVTGLILNVSSGSELIPLPNDAVYSATKAYLRNLTLALQVEARPYGIEIELLSPFFVLTKINSYSEYLMQGGLMIPDPDTYARSAVNRLGKVDQTSGYFWHGLQTALFKALPERFVMILITLLDDIR